MCQHIVEIPEAGMTTGDLWEEVSEEPESQKAEKIGYGNIGIGIISLCNLDHIT